MKRVLIVIPHYLPGYRSGGPQQTIQNVCGVFCGSADIYIVTLNHDYQDETPYPQPTNRWLDLYGVHILYVADREYSWKLFSKLYDEFDTIYACGLFCLSTIQMITLHNIKRRGRLYVAPMGVFSENALRQKQSKKRLFLSIFSFLGFFKRIDWSFTSAEEKRECAATVGEGNIRRFVIAEDIPRGTAFRKFGEQFSASDRGQLRIVFLSRIVPKKNLLGAVKILQGIPSGEIQFDIYGIIEDKAYWETCQDLLSKLPDNVRWQYRGAVRPEESVGVFAEYDVFLFPTWGENYGHVIFEALSVGCIPVISDRTPWKDLDAWNCGSVCQLEDEDAFRRSIMCCVDADSSQLMRRKEEAVNYAEKKYRLAVENSGYRAVFEDNA